MYDWVTHVHTHLGGECPHKCSYCYVGRNRFGRAKRYTGELRMIDSELNVDYGRDKIIFIEHMNDLFAEGVLNAFIYDVLAHARWYPLNDYVFQTKNPDRALEFHEYFPARSTIGTTIESDIGYKAISAAPHPDRRIEGIRGFKVLGFKTFITIEPIMRFSPCFAQAIIDSHPDFVNIGADSKNCGLPEPTGDEVRALVFRLQGGGVLIRKKVNLERILST
jgi:DNA repair photolyase